MQQVFGINTKSMTYKGKIAKLDFLFYKRSCEEDEKIRDRLGGNNSKPHF
jgi:hypothetical protein